MCINRKEYVPFAAFLLLIFMACSPRSAHAAETGCTDRDLMVATQIAYYDFGEERLLAHGGRALVRELLKERDLYRELENKVNQAEGGLDKLMAERSLALYNEVAADGSVCGGWYVVDVSDTNEADGFYGILIETDPQSAVVAFRGSESYDTNQIVKDWINADFGLLMDKDTRQQEKAAEYLAQIGQRFSYERYAVTGHSLGGNLAEHAAVAAPDGMREKLVQTVSFDGPGFSEEYMDRNRDKIGRVIHPISHYRWSLVGALLTHPDCTRSRVISVTEDIRPLEEPASNYLRHSTVFIRFEDGWVQDDAEDLLSKSMGVWSRRTDRKVMEERRKEKES